MRLNFIEMLKARNTDAPSLSRLMVWIAFLTCTGVIIWYAYNKELDWDIFGLYLVTMVGAYQGASYQARKVEEKKIDSVTAENCAPPEPPSNDPVNTDKMP